MANKGEDSREIIAGGRSEARRNQQERKEKHTMHIYLEENPESFIK